MKKKLDTRFPAARIKKIMQADEDVGKIAMAVPLLVSKALELFLQDLCDRAYEITLKRGAKTLNSSHLKQCVQTFNVFDFLRETVSKVPELGGSETTSEDRPASAIKRRRVIGGEENDSDGELKKTRTIEAGHQNSSGRGRGRERGRGRGRGARAPERDITMQNEKVEDDMDGSKLDIKSRDVERKDSRIAENQLKESEQAPVRDFDLNVDLDENGDLRDAVAAAAPPAFEAESNHDVKHEEFHGWSLPDVVKMSINPMQLTGLNGAIEDDEDYDEEG